MVPFPTANISSLINCPILHRPQNRNRNARDPFADRSLAAVIVKHQTSHQFIACCAFKLAQSRKVASAQGC